MKRVFVRYHFQLHEGIVPLFIWMRLIGYSIILCLKRIKRSCIRVIKYTEDYIIAVPIIVSLEVVMIAIGIFSSNYNSWSEGFWDLKEFLASSILISLIIGISSLEIKRHKELKKQFWIYQDIMYESEQFIKSLCKILKISVKNDIFYSHINFDIFYANLKDYRFDDKDAISNEMVKCSYLYTCTEQIPRSVAIRIYCNQYLRTLNAFHESLLVHDFTGQIEHALDQIMFICNEIQAELIIIDHYKESYNDKQLLKFIDIVSRTIFPVIIDIRHPWRWDAELNEKMRELIEKYKLVY